MLESIVSVLSSDWFLLSGRPRFSKHTVNHLKLVSFAYMYVRYIVYFFFDWK